MLVGLAVGEDDCLTAKSADFCATNIEDITRRMDEVNSQRSESLHAWSKNSRWFLFTSRRDDGLYTRLYFASIDATGRATKPFMLPQRNPKEYYRRLMYSYNTPDFTLHAAATQSKGILPPTDVLIQHPRFHQQNGKHR